MDPFFIALAVAILFVASVSTWYLISARPESVEVFRAGNPLLSQVCPCRVVRGGIRYRGAVLTAPLAAVFIGETIIAFRAFVLPEPRGVYLERNDVATISVKIGAVGARMKIVGRNGRCDGLTFRCFGYRDLLDGLREADWPLKPEGRRARRLLSVSAPPPAAS